MIAGALSAVLLAAVLTGTASPSPDASQLAGTAAGVGRAHPGRAVESAEEENPEEEPGSSPPTTASPAPRPAPHAPAAARLDGAAGERDVRGTPAPRPVLRILPLGTGLALTGLGLGFFALRLRRR
ncbi:hypothetical protein ACIHFE_15555 [Streptomyces sp. NPDC052396]|uniref:hypothetical protein n=1 Tax=Streptomyces sp. NPDC052396 TaxID=3365689 RepID=UPI0037D2D15B